MNPLAVDVCCRLHACLQHCQGVFETNSYFYLPCFAAAEEEGSLCVYVITRCKPRVSCYNTPSNGSRERHPG